MADEPKKKGRKPMSEEAKAAAAAKRAAAKAKPVVPAEQLDEPEAEPEAPKASVGGAVAAGRSC